MKISLFVVGKTNHNYLSPGIDDYTKRINHYIPFNIQYIADAKNTKNLSQAQQKQAEGQNLLNAFDNHMALLPKCMPPPTKKYPCQK